ncbi:MAG: hypothetical protein JL50_12205 [Peptococcaceae bacterium BICA1-7]|nr:MAG: hypothetical protein JL50_12205 [Peptococcaceae bacterium BICA1-7]
MVFFRKQKANPVNHDRADFTAAVATFSLAHTELISFLAMLKVQEISGSANELNTIGQSMAAMTEEVSASVMTINTSIQQVTSGAQESVDKINELSQLGHKTEALLKDMIGNVDELGSQVKHIDEISQNVSDIADQTNLLALNAAIEAARAGEAGRGFNVVAEEGRKLAGQTKEAVGNVTQISDQMHVKSNSTNGYILQVQDTFTQYLDNSNSVGETIKQSTEKIEECAGMIENITSAMEEQSATAGELSTTSDELTRNSAYIGQVLKGEANNLITAVAPSLIISGSGSVVNNLAARLIDHANFLKKTMAEAGKGMKVTAHHECAFGRWYNENKNIYGNIKAFKDIDEPHKRVHEAGGRLSNSFSSENVEELMQASTEILKSFIKLYENLKAES